MALSDGGAPAGGNSMRHVDPDDASNALTGALIEMPLAAKYYGGDQRRDGEQVGEHAHKSRRKRMGC